MTIFRIDEQAVKNAKKAMADDKETQKLLHELQENVDSLSRYVKEATILKHGLKKNISKVWKEADKKLKDRSISADARKALTEVRATTDQLWRELDKLGF